MKPAFAPPSWRAARRALVLGMLSAAALAASTSAPEGAVAAVSEDIAPPPGRAVPGEVIVRFKPAADAGERVSVRRDLGAAVEENLPLPGLQLLDLPPSAQVSSAVERLERRGAVRYAEPNFYRTAAAAVFPDDPGFDLQWGLHNTGQTVDGVTGSSDADIDAPEAWDVTVGAPGVNTAVIDTGVDYTHPDLDSEIWRNLGETGDGRESNGKDDDGNGYVDDWRGWDWVEADNTPQDENGHGTHVAGTAGASGNDDTGVTGVAWRSELMPLRVLDADGSGKVTDLIKAYDYAAQEGAEIVNASLGGGGFDQAEKDAIAAAPQTLFVVAAGNSAKDNDASPSPEYPCSYELSNIVCVAASNQNDGLASFSNFGAESVDLAAPGTNILSDYIPNPKCETGPCYAYLDGTSMATPHVAGTAALLLTSSPGASVDAVKRALLAGVDRKTAFAGKTVSGGRLNAARTLEEADRVAPVAFGPAERFVVGQRLGRPNIPMRFFWAGRDDVSSAAELRYDLEVRVNGGAWSRLRSSTRATRATYPLPPHNRFRFRVRAHDEGGNVSSWSAGPDFLVKPFDDRAARFSYRGAWRKRSASDAYGGTVHRSGDRGAKAILRFRGRDVGVAMPRGRFGKVKICLDRGTSTATCSRVNLGSGFGARRIVFARDGLDPGTAHKLWIKVLRGRVDLDAAVTAR